MVLTSKFMERKTRPAAGAGVKGAEPPTWKSVSWLVWPLRMRIGGGGAPSVGAVAPLPLAGVGSAAPSSSLIFGRAHGSTSAGRAQRDR